MIAHKFMTRLGWEVGRIVKKSGGSWDVKYPTESNLYVHELNLSDYGPKGAWVVVNRK